MSVNLRKKSHTQTKDAPQLSLSVTRSVVFDRKVLAAAVEAANKDSRSLSRWLNLQLRKVLGLQP